jgi:hypothetical protein
MEEAMSKCLRHFWIKENPFHSRPVLLCLLLTVTACALLTACADSGGYDEAYSPNLRQTELTSYNKGSSETQYIEATLSFDREVRAGDFMPKIRIANETVKDQDVEVLTSGSDVKITIRVDKIKDGDISIQPPAITDPTGRYTVKAQTIEALAPSGLKLETTENEAGKVTVMVTHVFDIRCIAWILFEDDGSPVTDSLLGGADERDSAVALHGHEFLEDDAYDVAENLSETLRLHFGDRYEFSADGKTVTATSKSKPGGELAISVYNYVRIKEKE